MSNVLWIVSVIYSIGRANTNTAPVTGRLWSVTLYTIRRVMHTIIIPPTAVRRLFWAACLQVSRKCYNLIESEGNMLNTSLWGRRIWQPTSWWGQGQQGHQCLLGGDLRTTITTGLYRTGFLLLATDESLSQCLFILANDLPPTKCLEIQCVFAPLELFWTHLSC